MVKPLKYWSPLTLNLFNGAIIVLSVMLCTLAMLWRIPGMELAGIGPNWVVVWVVTWSIKRNICQGILSGLCLGLLQDSLTAAQPTHVIGLVLVGLITGRLNKQRLLAEELASVALLVFCMAALVELVMAVQLSWGGDRALLLIWERLPQTALSSAILTSLWTPVVYYPLHRWWNRIHPLLTLD